MANPATRISLLQVLLVAGLLAVIGRAFQLQVLEGAKWSAEAERTRTAVRPLPPRRGTLYDRQGLPLAVTQEQYRVGVAAWEVPTRLRDSVATLLIRKLRLPAGEVRAAFRQAAREDAGYLYREQPVTASAVEELRRIRGTHLTRLLLRTYPSGPLARDIIGALDHETGEGRTGLERSLDSLLSGVPGEAGFLRDRRGELFESPDRHIRDPVPGHDIFLTLDADLQGIAETELAEAVERQDADAGDVVLVDPRSGEVLALAAVVRTPAGARRAGAWIPAEPGSTIKPFAAAGLLSLGRARAADSVHAENGEWALEGRYRPIRDTHRYPGFLTLARAIQVSSNIATVKFSMRLSPGEHFDVLRDFGFGSPTGLELPYESPGKLALPADWDAPALSQASIAQGYELEVTPLQLAAAYSALANGGLLPALTLIREIRDPEGRIVFRHTPRPLRRVIRPEVAAEVRRFLHDAAAEGGTGSRAQLANFPVIGKTGTARNVEDGVYAPGSYTASFAGLFPEADPQLAVVVRIVNPRAGEYYGGLVAAPVLRDILQEALASRRTALDRARLAQSRAEPASPREPTSAPKPTAVVVRLPLARGDSAVRSFAIVPDVRGLSVRDASLRLHRRGFRVALEGEGTVRAMAPAPGDSAAAGTLVQLRSGPRR